MNGEAVAIGLTFIVFIALAKRNHDLKILTAAFISTIDKALYEGEKKLDVVRDWNATQLDKIIANKLLDYLGIFQELVEPLKCPYPIAKKDGVMAGLINWFNVECFLYRRITSHFIFESDSNLSYEIHKFLNDAFICAEEYGMELKNVNTVNLCKCGYYVFNTKSEKYSTTGGSFQCKSCIKPSSTIKLH